MPDRPLLSTVPKVPPRLVAVAFDAQDPSVVAHFWAELLGRDVVDEYDGVLLPGDDRQVGLRFVASTAPKVGPNQLHLHLTSESREDQEATVARALGIGAEHLDVGQLPEEEHVVLRDPGGNEFCVIEAGNGFLAGCGPLGEVACDGSRAVGLFWHEALGWPLVWDQHEETAVQSPAGGTKLAWGGPAAVPGQGRHRQRVDLAAADPQDEAERLISLGATRRAELEGGVELADPDGHEFRVWTA